MKPDSLFRPRPRHGMVLLELVMALTVFSVVAFALVMALDTGMTTANQRNHIDAAVRGLQNQLALIHATTLNPIDEDLPTGPDGFLYHLTVVPEQLQDQKKQPVPGMYRVTIQVKWKDGAQEEDRSVTQLMYQP